MKKLTLYILFLPAILCAQTPKNDPIWQLKWQEEFNFNINNNIVWDAPSGLDQKLYLSNRGWTFESCNMQRDGYNLQTTNGTNLRMTNNGSAGVMRFTVDKLATPVNITYNSDCNGIPLTTPQIVNYEYSCGYLHMGPNVSSANDMDYGYYEMRFKIPPAIQNQQHVNRGIQTNWWMCCGNRNVQAGDPDHENRYFELDFFEISGEDNYVTHNYYNTLAKDMPGLNGNVVASAANQTSFQDIENANIRSTWKYEFKEDYAGFYKTSDMRIFSGGDNWDTVGVEVLPNTLNWYYNGKLVQSLTNYYYAQELRPTSKYSFPLIDNFPYIGWSEMEINAVAREGFNARWWDPSKMNKPDLNTVFPYYYDVDYIRFYKYTCNAQKPSLSMDAQSLPTSFSNEVYEYVEFGTRSGVPDILLQNASLRVKDYFLAGNGFEVPLGYELYVDNCDCEP